MRWCSVFTLSVRPRRMRLDSEASLSVMVAFGGPPNHALPPYGPSFSFSWPDVACIDSTGRGVVERERERGGGVEGAFEARSLLLKLDAHCETGSAPASTGPAAGSRQSDGAVKTKVGVEAIAPNERGEDGFSVRARTRRSCNATLYVFFPLIPLRSINVTLNGRFQSVLVRHCTHRYPDPAQRPL